MIGRRGFLIGGLGAGGALAGGLLLPPGQPLLLRLFESAPALELELPVDGRLGIGGYQVLAQLAGTGALARATLDNAADATVHSRLTLEEWLLKRLAIDDADDVSADEFGERLRQAIAEDFREQRLCEVDHWLLSETECRVAILRYHIHGDNEPSSDEDGFRTGRIVNVSDWGPKGTEQGTPVNVQRDGHSGLWFVARNVPPWLKLEIDGTVVDTFVSEDVFTSGLYGDLQERILAEPGDYELVLIDPMNRVRQPLGVFTVTSRAERALLADGNPSRVFCPVSNWGPRETPAGTPTNVQGENDTGLWFRVECAPDGTQVTYDGAPLVTTVDTAAGLVTARLPLALIAVAREADIGLYDPQTQEVLAVGSFRVTD